MKEQIKAYWVVPRNRMMGITLIGAFLCLAALMVSDETHAVRENVLLEGKAQKQPQGGKNFVREVAAGTSKKLRDPFRPVLRSREGPGRAEEKGMPKQTQAATRVTRAGGSKNKPSTNSVEQKDKLRLVGVIGSGGDAIALLEYREESKACGVGEAIGPYQVMRVFGENAVMDGPKGSFTMRVSR